MSEYRVMPLVGPDPHTPEWYALRLYDPDRVLFGESVPVVFTASEAGPLCGLSKYSTPRELFHRKRGELPPEAENAQMKRGNRFESGITDEFREARPDCMVMAPRPMLFHGRYKFLAATPDALVVPKIDGKSYPFDAKWVNWRRADEFGDDGSDDLPEDILLQAQQQILVCGSEIQETGALIGGDDFRIYTVHRNETIHKAIIKAAREMAARIINNDPPEPNWEHEDTPDLIKALFGVEDFTTPLSEETALYWANYRRLREEINDKEKEADALKARVAYAMGNAAVGLLPRGEKCILRKQVVVKAHMRKESVQIRYSEGDAEKWASK